MIVDQNAPPAVPDKLSAEPAQENDLADITETDLPPIYTQSHEGNAESSTSNPPSSSRSPPNIKPSNHIRVLQQNTSIKGSWLINPALRIPAVFLPPLADDETDTTRKNISLESKNGSLEVAIYVVPTQGEGADPKPSRQRVTIDTSSRNGPVTTAVYEVAPTEVPKSRLPLHISAGSKNGRVAVFLPRSFHGLINLELRNGNVRYSNDMMALLTPLSDVDGTHRSFLGHLDPAEFENEDEWVGDELNVHANNGNVRLYFNDETPPPTVNFWTKLFGV